MSAFFMAFVALARNFAIIKPMFWHVSDSSTTFTTKVVFTVIVAFAYSSVHIIVLNTACNHTPIPDLFFDSCRKFVKVWNFSSCTSLTNSYTRTQVKKAYNLSWKWLILLSIAFWIMNFVTFKSILENFQPLINVQLLLLILANLLLNIIALCIFRRNSEKLGKTSRDRERRFILIGFTDCAILIIYIVVLKVY